MGSIRWIILNTLAITVIHAAPRELSTDELITEPRPGEEYVNIQTNSHDKVNLKDHSFVTSHRIPEKTATFETAHKVPPIEIKSRPFINRKQQIGSDEKNENIEIAETQFQPRYEVSSTESVQVVTRTSIKMSKSKKVQKSVIKPAKEVVELDIKSSEGTIDETANADQDVKAVMAKKYVTNEHELKKPLRFNVPFEDEVELPQKPKLLSVGPQEKSEVFLTTTEEPPITTFNYKNVYSTSQKMKDVIQEKGEKQKYEIVSSESINAVEAKIPSNKKDTKQEKKSISPKKDENDKQDSGFYVLPVNKVKSQLTDENFDFVDLDEKILEPAGSSPGQGSRINIKKGPNGQEYEYVYYYYYYDDDDEEGKNATRGPTEEKLGQTDTTEKIYNGHDGPALETYQEKENVKSSTSGSKYLPTESPKSTQKSRKKTQQEDFSKVEDTKEYETNRVGSESTRYTSVNRQVEQTNNEILPSTSRPQYRSRGRATNNQGAQSVPTDDIPAIGEERLPSNTRFPPRSRNSSPTSPPPQEATSRTKNRDSGSQSRVRLPNLGLLDSSSFRTHSSDASIDEDPIHDAELQRRPSSRTQTTEAPDAKRDEITTLSHHRRGRPTTTTIEPAVVESEIPVSRRPTGRRPTERVPAQKDVQEPSAVQEEIPDEEKEIEKIAGSGRRPETTRESDLEEGVINETKPYQTPVQEESAEVKTPELTTEDESAVGLTSARMEKVALDLYAILQQAQDENIQTNFIDGNSTEIATEDEYLTEYTTFPTTTTTTTTEPTTTTTTTTAPTTAAASRGRYRGRGGAGAGHARARTKSTTTTTEVPVEPTSQRTRGRFQPNAANRATGGARRGTKSKVEVAEDVAPEKPQETPKPTAERTFGGRNRFRGAVKPITSTTTAATPSTVSGAAALSGSRGSSIDRFNTRRRGNRVSISTTTQPTSEDHLDPEKQEVQQDSNVPVSTEETGSSVSLKTGIRGRIHAGGARPLRPGPRVPLNLAHRGRVQSTTTNPPAEGEEASIETEQPAAPVEEAQEPVVTPAADPLSKLKNRPRLRIGPGVQQHRQVAPSPVTPPANRRKLVSSLLPKRRPGEEKAAEKTEEVIEEQHEEEVYEEDAAPSSVEPSSTTEADVKGLSGLLSGRRRNLARRPGTLYSRAQQAEAA